MIFENYREYFELYSDLSRSLKVPQSTNVRTKGITTRLCPLGRKCIHIRMHIMYI